MASSFFARTGSNLVSVYSKGFFYHYHEFVNIYGL